MTCMNPIKYISIQSRGGVVPMVAIIWCFTSLSTIQKILLHLEGVMGPFMNLKEKKKKNKQLKATSNSVFRENRCSHPHPTMIFSFSTAVTLKIKSRSQKSDQFFVMSQVYTHENLVKIQPLVHKKLRRQGSVTQTRQTPMGSRPKSICPPPLRWDINIYIKRKCKVEEEWIWDNVIPRGGHGAIYILKEQVTLKCKYINYREK